MRKTFDISALQWTDSDYLCPLCHTLLYHSNSDPNRKICANPKCSTSPSNLTTNTAIDPEVNQQISKSIQRFYIFDRRFLYSKMNEMRRKEFHKFFTQGSMNLSRVLGVDFLFTRLSHNSVWGTSTDKQIFKNAMQEFLERNYRLSTWVDNIKAKVMIIDQNSDEPYLVEYGYVIEDLRRNLGIINDNKYGREDVNFFYKIDNTSDSPTPKHTYDLESLFKMPSLTDMLNGLFKLTHISSQIHNYPAAPSHIATLLSLWAKCRPYYTNTMTCNELQEMHDGSVHRNKMNGNFNDFLQTYSSGTTYAPVLVFDGQHYHFDYSTLLGFLLYLISQNRHIDGIQTVSGYTTYIQQRQKRAHSFESAIRNKMRREGFLVLPQTDSEQCKLRAEGTEYEFDCIAIDHFKRIIVLAEAKYEDMAPSSTSPENMIKQLVLDKKNGLLYYAEKQHERRRFLVQNPDLLSINMPKNLCRYKIYSIIVTKFIPMIKRHLTTVLMSFDKFEHTNFRDSIKD